MAPKPLSVAAWEDPPVHPVNNAPAMSDAELKELANDIQAHGLQEPIILWRDNREEANGSTGPFQIYLLDGRNRLAALKRLGVNDPRHYRTGNITVESVRILRAIKPAGGSLTSAGTRVGTGWETDCDPAAFHLSRNVYRRHLTATQRRWMIKQAIIADPQASNAKIGRKTRASPITVATIRTEMGSQNQQFVENDHRPIERAKQALRDNPTLTIAALRKAANVSQGTACKARKELSAADQTNKNPKPTSKAKKQPKKHRVTAPHETSVPTLNLAWANATEQERLDFIQSHSPDIRAFLDQKR